MKDIAVYTCLTGNYDILRDPFHPDLVHQADFFCFTDNDIQSDIFQRVPLPTNFSDPILNSRYPKINAHEVLPDYTYTLYLDANLMLITDDLKKYISGALEGFDLAKFKHNSRDCLYEEAKICLARKLDSKKRINQQINRYRKLGFPEKYGLGCNAVIIRKNRSSDIVQFNRLWWDEYQKGSRRDQLSFDFVRWKTNLNVNHIHQLWSNNGLVIRFNHHKPKKKKVQTIYIPNLKPQKILKRINALRTRWALSKQNIYFDKKGSLQIGNKTLSVSTPQRAYRQVTHLFLSDLFRFPKIQATDALVLDIGAGDGLSSIFLKTVFPENPIISVEGSPERFKRLRKNCQGYSPKIEVHQFAIIGNTPVNIFFLNEDESISKSKFAKKHLTALQIPQIRLKNFLIDKKILFLKLSVSTSSLFEILNDSLKELSRVTFLYIEGKVPPHRPNHLADILQLLKKTEFSYDVDIKSNNKTPFLHHTTSLGVKYEFFIFAVNKNNTF